MPVEARRCRPNVRAEWCRRYAAAARRHSTPHHPPTHRGIAFGQSFGVVVAGEHGGGVIPPKGALICSRGQVGMFVGGPARRAAGGGGGKARERSSSAPLTPRYCLQCACALTGLQLGAGCLQARAWKHGCRIERLGEPSSAKRTGCQVQAISSRARRSRNMRRSRRQRGACCAGGGGALSGSAACCGWALRRASCLDGRAAQVC